MSDRGVSRDDDAALVGVEQLRASVRSGRTRREAPADQGRAVSASARRAISVVLALIGALAIAVAGWWAGRQALEPPTDPLASPSPTAIEVVTGAVGRSLPLSAVATWVSVASVRAPTDGVVTSLTADPSVPVAEGQPLLSVDLVPVVAAQGAVPAFRDLAPGGRGADIRQLQEFLARAGHNPGRADGVFSGATEQAVRAWQTASGTAVTGTVTLGSLVFVPQLPARIRPIVEVEATVAQGEPIAEILAAAPTFTLGVTEEQVSLIPPGAAVRVDPAQHDWQATIESIERVDGTPVLQLAGADGAPVCADTCADVPAVGESSWIADIELVPEVAGPVVPVGAVRTAPDGTQYVVLDDGTERDIRVVAAADGEAVVDGVEVGARVLLPTAPP